ncbi:MAG: SHOCT domain-containing protein [Arachnia sp.]
MSTVLMHVGHGGPGFFFLLASLALVIVILGGLRRNGRIGPVKWDGAPSGPVTPRQQWGWGASPEEQAMNRLKERLAEGEITPEEYLERTSVLRTENPTDTKEA